MAFTTNRSQQLHVDNCIWEIVYSDLKQHLESADLLPLSINASPPPRQSTTNRHHPSTEREPLKKTTTDVSTQTTAQSTPTAPNTRGECPNSNDHSRARPPSATIDSELQTPPPTYSPQPPQPIPSITSSPQPSKQPMLLSSSNLSQSHRNQLLQRKNLSFPPNLYLRLKIFTATSQRSTKQTLNNSASATQSLSRFLVSALPAFSRFLAEMQPKADNCCSCHSHIYHCRAMKAA
ncbi:unnamed protein product [Penicillium salamii]|nr:unnamed protein product [Penicillium salamii]